MKSIKMNSQNINLIKDRIVKGEILFLSPQIQENIMREKNEELTIPEYDSEYLTELAKVYIYMDKFKNRTKNKVLGELAMEAAFASYQYQKDNGYSHHTFESFFSDKRHHPFDYMFAYINADFLLNETTDGIRFDYMPLIAIREEISKEYSQFFNKTLSHEVLHQVTGSGIITRKQYGKKASGTLNEMCTEYNSFQIVKKYLDSNIQNETIKFTLLDKKGNKTKEMTLNTELAHYKPQTVFFPAIKHILPEINDIYFDREKNLSDLPKDKQKYTSLIKTFAINAELLCAGKNASYTDNICYEEKFDKIITSFSNLVEKYIRDEIGLTPNIDLDEIPNYRKAKQLQQFFDTFDNISFIKEGETLTQGEIIKRRVLFNVYQDEKKVDDALEALNRYKEVKEKESKNTSTILSSEKSPEENSKTTEIDSSLNTDNLEKKNLETTNDINLSNNAKCSKDNNNYKSKNKDNSKDIDLDL